MGSKKNKLVLDKNTIKNTKIKTSIKTGLGKTDSCITGGCNDGPVSTSANYSGRISGAF